MENISRCLTAWLNGFSGLEETDIIAYRDGSILLCVVQDVIEDIDFTTISDDLAGVMKCIEHAYQRSFPDIDITKASNATMEELQQEEDNSNGVYNLIRITSLLLGYTVQSNKKSDHIAAILALPEDIQSTLMERIELILQEVSGENTSENIEEGEENDATTTEPTIELLSSTIEPSTTSTPLHTSTIAQFTSPKAKLTSHQKLTTSLQKVHDMVSPSANLTRRAVSLSMPLLASLAAENACNETTMSSSKINISSTTPTKDSSTKRQRFTAFTSPSGATPNTKQYRNNTILSPKDSVINSTSLSTFTTDNTTIPPNNNVGGNKTSREMDAENNALKEEVSDLRDEIERYKRRVAILTQAANEVNQDTSATVGRQSIMGAFGNPYRKTNIHQRSTLGGGMNKSKGRVSLAGGDDILAFMKENMEEQDDDEDNEYDSDMSDNKGSKSQGATFLKANMEKLQEELITTKASLAEAENKIKQLQLSLTKAEQDNELITKLRDEIDILRPQAAAKERAEQMVERLKKRVDAFGEVKESLKKTEQLNQELTNKLFDTEKEAAKVKPLRQALEEAKENRTTAEIRASELEAALLDAQHTCEELRSALSIASSSSSASSTSSSTNMMNDNLHELSALMNFPSNDLAALHHDNTSDSNTATTGTGLQEFNPDLAAKLARLERENSELQAIVATGEAGVANSARVLRLETELDDLRRIKSAFEGKFHQFKNKSMELETSLTEHKQQIQQLETTIRNRDSEITLLQTTLTDTKYQLEQANTQITHLTSTLADVRATHTADVTLWMNKYDDKSNELAREKSSFTAYVERSKLEIERINAAHNETIQEMERQLRESINDASHRAENVARSHEHALSVLRADAVAAAEAAQQKYTLLEASAAARLSAAQENATTAATLAAEAAERTLTTVKAEYERKEQVLREEYAQLQEQMRQALENAQQVLEKVQTEAETKYTALQTEMTNYQAMHSMSDAERQVKITQLETSLAESQALVQGLENQKQQGLLYVASLQERIQQAEEEAIQTADTANQELETLHAQLEVVNATNDESTARIALLESRLLEARKDAEAMKEKATKLSRELSNIEAKGGIDGSEVSIKLKELTTNLESIYNERDFVGKQLSAALTHIQNLGHNVPPCILDGIIPDPIGHGSAATTNNNDGENENTVGTRTRRQKATTGTGGARRVMRGANANTNDDDSGTNNYTNNSSSSTTNTAVMVAELRSLLASKEMDIVRAQTAVEEQRQLRLHAEIKAEEATDNIEVLEKRLTRATLHTQRLVKALEDAGVHVMNAETGMIVNSDNQNSIDLNGSLIINDDFNTNFGNTGSSQEYDQYGVFPSTNQQITTEDDEFVSGEYVLGSNNTNTNNNIQPNYTKPNFATMASNQQGNNNIRPRLSMLPTVNTNTLGGGLGRTNRTMGSVYQSKTMINNNNTNSRLSFAPSGTL